MIPMAVHFRVGDRVFWWKRVTRASERPYAATVVAVGESRIRIELRDSEGGPNSVLRQVRAHSLQPVGGYFEKAPGQRPYTSAPTSAWGSFTRYLEIGADLYTVRQVDEFDNGHLLSYDRTHWIDVY